jgi:hypothetical protein
MPETVIVSAAEYDRRRAALVRKLNAYIDGRDALAGKSWARTKTLIADARNEILNEIKRTPPDKWAAWYLPRLLDAVEKRAGEMEGEMSAEVAAGQKAVWTDSMSKAGGLEQVMGLRGPLLHVGTRPLEAAADLSAALIRGWTMEAIRDASNVIALGIAAQKSTWEVAKDLAERLGVAEERAKTIARTEMLRTQSVASQARFIEVSKTIPDAEKGWYSSHKPAFRQGHLEAERKYSESPIPVADRFSVRPDDRHPYEDLLYPRDPAASAENTINCGCVQFIARAR